MTLTRLTWEPKYSVQNETLDAQHQKLFTVVNRLLDVFESDADVLPTITELIDYLSTHFHAEHLVMLSSNFPEFPGHSAAHQKFNAKVSHFIDGYKEGKNSKDIALDMVVFLRDWIQGHTCSLDQKYASHLRNQASNPPKPPR